MTPQERNELFENLHQQEVKLLLSKGADYAGDEDALSNFKINAERLGLTKYQVWSVYFMKHIDSILNAIKNNPSVPERKTESVLLSTLDGRNYLGLLACMITEDAHGNLEKVKQVYADHHIE